MVKVLGTFVEGKLTEMKELPRDQDLLEREGLDNYQSSVLLREIDETEKRTLMLVRDNFDDLRDFVYRNI